MNTTYLDQKAKLVQNYLLVYAPKQEQAFLEIYDSVKGYYLHMKAGQNKLDKYLDLARLIASRMRGSIEELRLCLVLPLAISARESGDPKIVVEGDVASILDTVIKPEEGFYDTYTLVFRYLVSERATKRMYRELYPSWKMSNQELEIALNILPDYYKIRKMTNEPYVLIPWLMATDLAEWDMEEYITCALLFTSILDGNINNSQIEESLGWVNKLKLQETLRLYKQCERERNGSSTNQWDIAGITQRLISDSPYGIYFKHCVHVVAAYICQQLATMEDRTLTEFYIPLFKSLKLNRCVMTMQDHLERMINPTHHLDITIHYNRLKYENSEQLIAIYNIMLESLGCTEKGLCTINNGKCKWELRARSLLPYELMHLPNHRIKYESHLMEIELLVEDISESESIHEVVERIMHLFNMQMLNTYIIDYRQSYRFDGSLFSNDLLIIGNYRNQILLRIMDRQQYYLSMHNITKVDEMPISSYNPGTIIVRKRNRLPMQIDRGATALDFAFAIHEEVGLCAKKAIINDKERALNTVLADNDCINIETATMRDRGGVVYKSEQACFKWITYVNTVLAKECLYNYFIKKYDSLEE